MIKIKNALSLFDGISCGRVALERAEIEYEKYYASEIDKFPIKVAQKNFPDTIQLGDVKNWREWDIENIDLIIGGSPCQGFSFAGKQLNFDDPRSKLFFDFVDIVRHFKPKYFILENVVMKQEFQDIITEYMGVKPIMINSSLVSAQKRRRLYWTNIPNICEPKDKGIVLKDIVQENVSSDFDLKGGWLRWWKEKKDFQIKKRYSAVNPDKAICMTARQYANWNGTFIEYNPATIIGRRLNEFGKREDYNKDIKITQCLEVRGGEKMNCLTTVQKDTVISPMPKGRYKDAFNMQDSGIEEGVHWRKLTPIECERLQTLPDNYTEGVSNSQRYKALGNGWTVDVIVHIMSFME